MQFSKSILIAAAALIAPLAMNATPLSGAPSSLSLGDMTFSSFTCTNTCEGVNVGTITTPAAGLQFSTQNGWGVYNGSGQDTLLGYNVTSTSGITSVGLAFSPVFEGFAVDSVTETIFAAGNTNPVASLKVICTDNSCGGNEVIDLAGSYTDLSVTKDIQLKSFVGTASQFSWVDQTFSETATPEPASLALVGAGLLAAGAIRRKMVKA